MRAVGGILLVDKPAGATSFAVVNAVRRRLVAADPALASRRSPGPGPRPPRFRCGHAGTLDPLATGLLVVLVGRGSRLSPFLMGLDKTYHATVRFGTATDTLDADGRVTATAAPPASPERVRDGLAAFRGAILQVPPLISALKRDGRALHRRVRAGEEVAAPEARPVTIHRLEMTAARWDAAAPEVDLEIACSSGTYVRALARDLAEAAGSVGHVAALRRTAVGPFTVEEALTGILDAGPEEILAALRPLADALPHVPALAVTAAEADLLRAGGQPEPGWRGRLPADVPAAGKAGRIFRIIDPDGVLVAVGKLDEATGLPRTAAVLEGKG